MLEATILPNFVFTRSDRLRPNTKIIRLSGSELDKTIVDDFAMTGYCKLVSNLALRAAEVRLVIRFVNMREAIPRTPHKKQPPRTKHNPPKLTLLLPTVGVVQKYPLALFASGCRVGVVQNAKGGVGVWVRGGWRVGNGEAMAMWRSRYYGQVVERPRMRYLFSPHYFSAIE
tara:strand:+ start:39 stop:554 length:516 start_codon:yes stop_codon:yes gene_type:complete